MEQGQAAVITITETGAPSRSKGRGWARIGSGDDAVFATATGRTVTVPAGQTREITIGVELHRAKTGVQKLRDTWTLIPEAGTSVDLSLGSPQSYDVHIEGAHI